MQDVYFEIPREVYGDERDDPAWDGYERSILRSLADEIQIGIRGGLVDMTVRKDYSE